MVNEGKYTKSHGSYGYQNASWLLRKTNRALRETHAARHAELKKSVASEEEMLEGGDQRWISSLDAADSPRLGFLCNRYKQYMAQFLCIGLICSLY